MSISRPFCLHPEIDQKCNFQGEFSNGARKLPIVQNGKILKKMCGNCISDNVSVGFKVGTVFVVDEKTSNDDTLHVIHRTVLSGGIVQELRFGCSVDRVSIVLGTNDKVLMLAQNELYTYANI